MLFAFMLVAYIVVAAVVFVSYLEWNYKTYGWLQAADVIIGFLVAVIWLPLVAFWLPAMSVVKLSEKVAKYYEKKWSANK